MWVEQALTLVGLFRDLSWSLSCPAYCGSSILLPLIAGLSFGLVLGFIFGVCFIHRFCTLNQPTASQPQANSFETPLTRARFRANRLEGYLHE